MLHERGWRSIYIPDCPSPSATLPRPSRPTASSSCAGRPADSRSSFTHNPLNPRRRLTIDQRLQYLVTATFYLVGICPLLLMLVPPLEIYFDLRPMNLSITWLTWLLYYSGFYVMQIVLACYTHGFVPLADARARHGVVPDLRPGAHQRALGQGAELARDRSQGKRVSPFNFMIPQVLFFVFLLLTSVVAHLTDVGNGMLTLATAWNVTNTLDPRRVRRRGTPRVRTSLTRPFHRAQLAPPIARRSP